MIVLLTFVGFVELFSEFSVLPAYIALITGIITTSGCAELARPVARYRPANLP